MNMFRPGATALYAIGLAGLSFAVGSACAQQPTAGPQHPEPSPAPVPTQTVLRSNASTVLLDVVVTENGIPVHDLARQHFHVLEQGKEQPISFFEEHRPGAAAPVLATHGPLAPNVYTNIPDARPSTAVNVLLLDALNTPVTSQMNVRLQMLQYMAKIEPGTSMAIFTLSSRLRMVQGFTANVGDLVAAVRGAKAGPQHSVILDPEADQQFDSTIGDLATMGTSSSAISSLQQFQADMTAFQTDMRVQMTMDAMRQLARYLSAIPGRKNLIWFSGSFPLSLDPDMTLSDPFRAMRDYTEQLRTTSEMLSSARVAVYPVDARGLMVLPSTDASRNPSTNLVGGGSSGPSSGGGRRGGRSRSGNPVNNPSPNKDDTTFLQQTAAEQASMAQIAQATGGKEFINTNGLKEAVADAVQNGANYYTIGYVPVDKNFHGEFRKLKVHIDATNAKLAYRNGYYADPPDKPSPHNPSQTSLIIATTIHGAPPSTQILFKTRVLPATDPFFKETKLADEPAGEMAASLKTPPHRYIVDLSADPRDFLFTTGDDGNHHARVEFTIVAYDGDGNRVNYIDKGFGLSLSDERLAMVRSKGFPLRLSIDLPAGSCSLRIAVHDIDADRAGSLEVPVMVK